MVSIYNEVMNLLGKEETKVSEKAFNVLNKEGIADIVKKNGMFCFEVYVGDNDCPKHIHEYLVKFIERKLKLKYLYKEVSDKV